MVCVAVKGVLGIGVIHKPFNTEAHTFWAWVGKVKSSNLKYARSKSENKDNNLNVLTGEIKKVLREKIKIVDIIEAAGAGYKALEVVLDNVEAYLHITSIMRWDICAGNAIIKAVEGYGVLHGLDFRIVELLVLDHYLFGNFVLITVIIKMFALIAFYGTERIKSNFEFMLGHLQ
ncbi:putative inositol monophosphatase 3 [Tribolium castaneum]|uniref:putative inositol monophosphatase 3 n=1 Tax=Tribolium castaneum TaxID=7070 RepID=UPI0030FF07BC